MKLRCECGARVFLGNTQCLQCGHEIGRCENCGRIACLDAARSAVCPGCLGVCVPCSNREGCGCESLVITSGNQEICRWCQTTEVVPDLGIAGNQFAWATLEREKRRLIQQVEELGLPLLTPQTEQPLHFRFLADQVGENGTIDRVYTGHCEGIIVINIQEADSVYRERTRIELGEPQRTIIGHLRHEYGHFLDFCLDVKLRDSYNNLFGDPQSVQYESAKQRYYERGPVNDWKKTYVSAYASMHPWEDFAETANLYLDLMAIIDTVNEFEWIPIQLPLNANLHAIVSSALQIAIAVSEFNADLGLPHLLPESIPDAVFLKLEFIHSIRQTLACSR